jgi:hypothetical protein
MSRDVVSPELHRAVLRRDACCFAYRLDRTHICRDMWGRSHGPGDLAKLTVDHVHDAPTMGRRAPSDPAHLVALCWWANVGGWASAHRDEEREYLAGFAPIA